jgi:hypothetical protein
MGFKIENNEKKLVISEDENVGDVKHLLNQMGKEDGKRKQKKIAKGEKEFIGDESDDDDLSEDKFDDEDEEDVEAIHTTRTLMTRQNVATVLARFGWSCF